MLSKESTETILFDNQIPTVSKVEINGTQGENGWITSTGEINIIANDNTEGEIAGYTYEVYNLSNELQKESKGIIKINVAIPIETDGIWKVKINAIDQAGNKSIDKIVEVKKDTIEPAFNPNKITIVQTGSTSVKISVRAIDETSGDTTNGGRITYYYYATEAGTSSQIPKGNNTTRRERNNRTKCK